MSALVAAVAVEWAAAAAAAEAVVAVEGIAERREWGYVLAAVAVVVGEGVRAGLASVASVY